MFTAETGFVGVAPQPVKGTFVEPTDFVRVNSIDINPEAEKIIPDVEIGGSRDVTEILQGSYKVSGSIDAIVRPEGLGHFLKGFFGDYTAEGEVEAGLGNYLHTFLPINSGELPMLSIKKGISTSETIQNFLDCKVDSFAFDMVAGEVATLNFGIIGSQDKIGASVTPAYETAPILVSTKGTVTIGGVVFKVQSCKLEGNNNLSNDDFRVGSRFLETINEKRRDFKATLDIVLDNTSKLHQKAFFGSSTATEAGYDVALDSVVIEIESPTLIGTGTLPYKLKFSIDNAAFETAEIPSNGDDLIVVPLEMRPIKTGSTEIMKAELWNSKITY